MSNYEFTTEWFYKSPAVEKGDWNHYLNEWQPRKILEVGSYEGCSTTYMIERNTWTDDLELYSIDTWEGGVEHKRERINMSAVEQRFDRNINTAKQKSSRNCKVRKFKSYSHKALCSLIEEHEGTFDWVYIDGSHQALDVLTDAILSWKLLREGGMMVFDDYIWYDGDGKNPLDSPKIGIDTFLNMMKHTDYELMFATGFEQIFVKKLVTGEDKWG